MTVTGGAAVTLSRGSVVWKDGELRTERGAGRYLPRACFPDYWVAQGRRNLASDPTPVKRSRPERAA